MGDVLSRILVAAFFCAVVIYGGILLIDAAQKTVEHSIEEGRILLNMTEEQVLQAWGEPDQITTTRILIPGEPRPTVKVTSVWTYHDPSRTVTFEKGHVVEFSATEKIKSSDGLTFLTQSLRG